MFIAANGIRTIITNADIDRLRVLYTDALQRCRARVCGAITIGAGIIGLTFFFCNCIPTSGSWFNEFSLHSEFDSGA